LSRKDLKEQERTRERTRKGTGTYHVQINNRDSFLSTDFGLKEFNVKNEKERIRRYRRYVYEAGALKPA
jgi:hypothetical protein